MFKVEYYDRLTLELFKTKTFNTVKEMEVEINDYGPKGHSILFFEGDYFF
ncbi:MAG: hypothetical protein ACQEXB_01230 [Bacillota bacterium]